MLHGAIHVLSTLLASLLGCLAGCSPGGCPNVCDITVQPAVVDPALSCLTAQTSSETCDCGVQLEVGNQCDSTLQFPTGTFYYCGNGATTGQNCDDMSALGTASGQLRVGKTGEGDWVLSFQEDGAAYTMTISYDVTSLGSGGCSIAGPETSQPPPRMVGLLAFALGACLLRRWRHKKDQQRFVAK
jgi:hypothetical protein